MNKLLDPFSKCLPIRFKLSMDSYNLVIWALSQSNYVHKMTQIHMDFMLFLFALTWPFMFALVLSTLYPKDIDYTKHSL